MVALGVVIALILLRHNRVRSYGDCMSLAARYLEELDFEQAETMYLEALQLDPSRAVSAYDQAEPMSYSEIVTAIENY